ncbi:MAG: PHP-associated domain-containing protein [Dehalococcoidia bacterium]
MPSTADRSAGRGPGPRMSGGRQHGRIDPSHLASVGERRPPGGAIFEMHAHCSDRSLDSGVRVDVLVAQAAWRGLDGVCLTDHNAAWDRHDLIELSERHEIHVFGGMELGTDAGHVLVFGLDRYHPELLVLERLRRVVESEAAAMVLAHPMRPFHGVRPGPNDFAQWFEGIEVINGDHSDSEHGYLAREAKRLALACVGGSDAHSKEAVGRIGTVFPGPVRAIEQIVGFLREGTTDAVDFRPRGAAPAK